jgi:hypothetical protein
MKGSRKSINYLWRGGRRALAGHSPHDDLSDHLVVLANAAVYAILLQRVQVLLLEGGHAPPETQVAHVVQQKLVCVDDPGQILRSEALLRHWLCRC